MRRFVWVLTCTALMVALLVPAAAAKTFRIGIVQLIEHPALDASREGFLAGLGDAGYTDGNGVEIDYQNAQGDMTLLGTIVRNFVNNRVDLIHAITTPAAQTVAGLTDDIPVVFAAVRDPLAAELVASFDEPGGNITGTTHYQPVSEQIELVRDVLPGVKRIGIVYNAGEVNSMAQVLDAREWAKDVGVKLVERTVSKSVEVQQATESLVGQVDTIYVPTDNTVVAGLEGLISVANRANLPVIAADVATVQRGAIAAYGADFFKLGRLAGEMAVKILRDGADPGKLPLGTEKDRDLALNVTAAKEIGLEIPADVVAKADTKF